MDDFFTAPASLLATVVALAAAAQWLAFKTRLPAILYLLLIGLAAGPLTGWLEPDALLGPLLLPVVSLAVAVILFEGALTLHFAELRDIGPVVRNLVGPGALLNGLVTAAAAHVFVGLAWPVSLLFGALMIVTGPTVIMPMLRTVRPTPAVARVLRWEGIVIDPLGALFALLVFEWLLAQHSGGAWLRVAGTFLQSVAAGAGFGLAAGLLLGQALRRGWIPEFLHNFAALAAVVLVFTLADHFAHESGLLAVTVMGMALANMPDIYLRPILEFKEQLTVMLVSFLFIVLAARVDLGALRALGWGALGVLLAMQFLARPLKVFVSTIGSSLSWRERVLLAWIGPRGIVAAAVSAVFAIALQEQGVAGAEALVPLAFVVIIGTVLVQGLTARPFARLLGVTRPEPGGALIVGANPVARTIGAALKQAGVPVVLADGYWENIRAAREQGLSVYYGNVLSEHAALQLDLAAFDSLLGLSHYDERNLAAVLHFRDVFGRDKVYLLATRDERRGRAVQRFTPREVGRILFGEDVTYGVLAGLIARGAVVKKTRLTEAFDFSDWRAHYEGRQTVALFAQDPAGRLHWFCADKPPAPAAGWTVFALSEAERPEAGTA
ncbi:MAG: sodium/hydrogen antiporter [Gammaproteobacteria bacterium]|nr:MAG: sodium/hydrogen antiporter [Gammaproteobacteria bacterium]